MSKTITHCVINSTISACGIPYVYRNAAYREQVTCKKCKKTDLYKMLPTLPKTRKELK